MDKVAGCRNPSASRLSGRFPWKLHVVKENDPSIIAHLAADCKQMCDWVMSQFEISAACNFRLAGFQTS